MHTVSKREKTEVYVCLIGIFIEYVLFDGHVTTDNMDLINYDIELKRWVVGTILVADLALSIRSGLLIVTHLIRIKKWLQWKTEGIIKTFYASTETDLFQDQALIWLDTQGISKNIIPDKVHSGKIFKYISTALPKDLEYEFTYDGFKLRTCTTKEEGKNYLRNLLENGSIILG